MTVLFFVLSSSVSFLLKVCFFILIFSSLNRLYLIWLYKKKFKSPQPRPESLFDDCPHVTVQLPIFNEAAVVERLINAVCALDYPSHKLEIQVLDDSTDETTVIAQNLCEGKKRQNIDIKYIHRKNREGYKAGALQNGLATAAGEFIAVFDADFLPPPDFLKKTIHYFTNDKIGWVQASWSHLNKDYSLLTQCLALVCDFMFLVEDVARQRSSRWGIFHGTAGILRKTMIQDAGGWQWDTLTEDSDLSYRALMKGWKYITLTDLSCPCELPPSIPVFITQQARWSKGSIQVVKKLAKNVLTSRIRWSQKYDFISYLTSYLFCPALSLLSLIIMPYFILRQGSPVSGLVIHSPVLFFLASFAQGLIAIVGAFLILFLFFTLSQKSKAVSTKYIAKRTIIFVLFSLGLSPFVTYSTLEGFFKKDTEFIRTPKYNIKDTDNRILAPVKTSKKILKIARVEILASIYVSISIITCCYIDFMSSVRYLPILLLFFGTYFYFGIIIAFPHQRLIRNIFVQNNLAAKISTQKKSIVVQ